MKSIRALTLQKGKMTAARRTSAVPQLTCEGKACRIYQPDVVQCTAVGDDGAGGLEWSCTAELPKGVRFGAVEVSCEGWGEFPICGTLKRKLIRNSAGFGRRFERSLHLERLLWSHLQPRSYTLST